jgi:hypothetical protein
MTYTKNDIQKLNDEIESYEKIIRDYQYKIRNLKENILKIKGCIDIESSPQYINEFTDEKILNYFNVDLTNVFKLAKDCTDYNMKKQQYNYDYQPTDFMFEIGKYKLAVVTQVNQIQKNFNRGIELRNDSHPDFNYTEYISTIFDNKFLLEATSEQFIDKLKTLLILLYKKNFEDIFLNFKNHVDRGKI